MRDSNKTFDEMQFLAQAATEVKKGTLANGFKTAGNPWADYLPGTLPWSRNWRAPAIFIDLPFKFRQEPHRDNVAQMVNACVLGAST
jgi:hypothetical protein